MKVKSIICMALIGSSLLVGFSKANTDWFEILGLTFYDKKVSAVFGKYGDKSSHIERSDTVIQMNWEDHGIALTMDVPGHIVSVYFFNDQYKLGDYTFDRFQEKLPLNVNFNLTPKEVIDKLGSATVDEGSSYRRLFYKTNYEYEFLFRKDVMQYMRIGVLNGVVEGKTPKIGKD